MEVYVVRHGLTELNKQKKVNGQIDEPLAPEGIKQAKAAISLIPESTKHIYSSTLLRARQTAEIINAKLNRPISYHNELGEIHMGSLAGKAWVEMKGGIKLKIKHRSIQFDYRSYGGESAAEVKKRLTAFLKEIKGKHSDHEALLVTHGGIIRLMYLLEYDQPLVDEIEHILPHTFDLSKILKRFNA